MKSSQPMVKCLLLFTTFHWDEITPIKKAEMTFHEKKIIRCVKTSSGMKFYDEHVFSMYPICFPTLTCLNIMKVTTNVLQDLFT